MTIYPFETRHSNGCGDAGEAREYPLGTILGFRWDDYENGVPDEAVVVMVRDRDGRPHKAWVLIGNL
jgi:hypothetical protein